MEYYEVIDLEAIDSSLSNNGGDYDYWRVVVVENGTPIAMQWRSSMELDMFHCNLCDSTGHQSDWCPVYRTGATSAEEVAELSVGWESGRKINRPRWPLDEYPRNWLRVRK